MNKLVCSCLYDPLISEQGANMSYMTTVLSVTRSLYLTGRKQEKTHGAESFQTGPVCVSKDGALFKPEYSIRARKVKQCIPALFCSYYHLNFYIFWKALLRMQDYCFHVITSKCSANAKFRIFTIFTIVIHRSQLYTTCFVSVYLHTQFNNLESTCHYLLYDRDLHEQVGSCAICWE